MTDFLMPPVRHGPSGQLRRVGYEIEYAGVDIETSARIVNEIAGGTLKRTNPFHYDIRDTGYGDFSIEVDATLLHEQAYEKYLEHAGIDIDNLDLRAPLEKLLLTIANMFVPHEIITPPLALDSMDIIDSIRAALVEMEARGTSESILYGFGVHINPELPAEDADTLLAHLRAYCLLYDWICKQSRVDWSRRIGPYINHYPEEYIELIMQPDYKPSRRQLAHDYIYHIPSRNHALDMLPALVYLEGNELLPLAREPGMIKPRPAFHYRLPNCLIGDPHWQVAHEWHYWVMVERLAANTERLTQIMNDYRQNKASWLHSIFHPWPDVINGHIEAL